MRTKKTKPFSNLIDIETQMLLVLQKQWQVFSSPAADLAVMFMFRPVTANYELVKSHTEDQEIRWRVWMG